MIGDEEKEQVRQATDVLALVGETVELRQRGAEFWGCCPFHHEKSPSFHVNPQTGLWHCFGCHKGGDVFRYVMEREHLEFVDAIRYLADRAHIELKEDTRSQKRGPRRSRLIEITAAAESFFSTMLLRGKSAEASAARSYLSGRGFGLDVCKRWSLGFAPGRGRLVEHLRSQGFSEQEIIAANLGVISRGRLADRFFNRVMFPIHNERFEPIAFGGRVLGDGKPKYLNTKETPLFHKSKNLFGIDQAKQMIAERAEVLVTEGYTDVIALHEHGFQNAVAALGTALSLDHIRLLARFRPQKIVCMFDGDAAGQKAAELAVQYIDQTEAAMLCVVLPENLDPMEFLQKYNPVDLRAIIDAARPLMDFVIEKKLSHFNLGIAGQRSAALDALAEVLSPLKNSVNLDRYVADVAARLDTDFETTKAAIKKKRPSYTEQNTQSRSAVVPAPVQVFHQSSESVLSSDARKQLSSERALLALFAAHPSAVRPYQKRLTSVHWVDSRHKAMAEALFATDTQTTPEKMVLRAAQVVPNASEILSSGSLLEAEGLSDDKKADFLVNLIELCSMRREVLSIQAKLKSEEGGVRSFGADSLFERANKLQAHIRVLNKKVRSVVG